MGLSAPERFAAAGSFSGPLDIAGIRSQRDPHRESMLEAAFGTEDLHGSEHDLFQLLADLSASGSTAPDLFVGCGAQDGLLPHSVQFARAAKDSGLTVTTSYPPGEHSWPYWDRAVRELLDWLPLRTRR